MTAGLHISTVCFDTQHLNGKTRVTAEPSAGGYTSLMWKSNSSLAMYIQLSSSRSSTSW